MLGESVGNFTVVAELGQGGMGQVFLAEHRSIGTRVAIKVLHREISRDRGHVQRFFNEARAVSRIRHAGIVKIFDVGFHREQAYLVMEFLDGEALAARIGRVRAMPVDQLGELCRQIAGVLDATHDAGITHRDLKPDNIFLVPDQELEIRERVKILDFGIAKLTGTLAGASPRTVGTMGTPSYMAPEQWGDTSRVDWRADAYALGCVAFEMATGKPPFEVTSIADACHKHLSAPPPPLRSVSPGAPAALEALLVRLLAKAPADRPGSMREIADAFARVARGEPAATATAASAPTVLAPSVDTAPPASSPVSTPPGEPAAQRAMGDLATPTARPVQTTLRASSGEVARGTVPAAPRSRRRLALVGVLGAGALAGAVYGALSRGDGSTVLAGAADAAPQVRSGTIDAATIAATTPEPSLQEILEDENPFVEVKGGLRLQERQVSRSQYRQFLASLPTADADRARPYEGWAATAADGDDATPVAWTSHEQAARFCRAIDARLPDSDEWHRAARGAWGLDPSGSGTVGPLQEWTATVQDGLAVVRGAHAEMTATAREQALAEPLLKITEALAGDDATAETLAAATIGFRCAR